MLLCESVSTCRIATEPKVMSPRQNEARRHNCAFAIEKGRRAVNQFKTSAAAGQPMTYKRPKDLSVRPDRAQGAQEDEAKEHDLPLVQ
jgi:hypothetical protein